VRRLLAAVLAGLLVASSSAYATAPALNPFSDWAAIIVAGDDHASHSDDLTETFDNARRDVAGTLVHKGFSATNMAQFSMRPKRYPDARPQLADLTSIDHALAALTARARGGCLIYFTTHGAPEGMALDDDLLSPRTLAHLITERCAARPTVVIVSACFSGVFVPALKAPDRMILTAARRDRSSFGCGESDKYPFFDACMLEVLPGSPDFPSLGPAVRSCVARREREEDMAPPSEPQVWIGAKFNNPRRPFAATAGG
jgi:hypothetical protein